jgi:hypothetical protein
MKGQPSSGGEFFGSTGDESGHTLTNVIDENHGEPVVCLPDPPMTFDDHDGAIGRPLGACASIQA